MGRYDKVAARTDNDITDDATGQARIEMAAASKARRQVEQAERVRQNAEMKKRLKSVEASTDDQLDTERAALARAEMAAASKARLAAENAERRRHAREMEERIRNTGPRTDNEMDTEAAAIARAEMAARSRAHKEWVDAERKRQNQDMQQMIKTVAPRTDNLMDTEAAALARSEMAAASKERRRQEAIELRKWNAHMKQKIAAAQDEDGWDPDAQALCELIAAQELDKFKGSNVSRQQWIMYQSWREKTAMGDEIRRERKEHEQRKKELHAEFLGRAQVLASQRQHQTRTMRKVAAHRESRIAARGRELKAQEMEWEQRKRAEKKRHEAKIKKRVAEARGLDSRLDQAEEAQDAWERQEANVMKLHIADALKATREERMSARRELVNSVRDGSRQALYEVGQRSHREATARAQEKRNEQAFRRQQKEAFDREYLADARVHAATRQVTRAKVRSSVDSMQRQKLADAQRIRSWSATEWDLKTVADGIISRKKQVAEAYATRYVSSEAADEWMGSPLHRLHAAARFAMETATKAVASTFGGSPGGGGSGRSPFHASSPGPAAAPAPAPASARSSKSSARNVRV